MTAAVLFGQEKEPSISNGTTYQNLGTYSAPGVRGFFPSTLDAVNQSLKVGDDLWVAVMAIPSSTVGTAVISASMDPSWDLTFYSAIDTNSTFRGTKDVSLFNYGPSPVDAAGWAAWAPDITINATGITFPTSRQIVISVFAIRNAATAPQFTSFLAGANTDPRTPNIDTWTGTDTYAVGFVGGPSYSGGGVNPGDVALYPGGDGPINGWDLAQSSEGSALMNRTWYGRVTTDTAAPSFVITTFGWFWFGFQIGAIDATGWSVGQIRY